jgi:hypothetical protein
MGLLFAEKFHGTVTRTRRNVSLSAALLALSTLGLPAHAGGQPPQSVVAANDTAFYSLMRMLVTDSLWPSEKTAPPSYFVTNSESLMHLRRAGVQIDSTYPARYIGCRENPETATLTGDAVLGYVLSASVGPGMDSNTLALHLTVGCRVGSGASVRATGHYCAWDVIRDGQRWRVYRSRRCWAL